MSKVAVFCLTLACLSLPARATAQPDTLAFDIAAQPLESALGTFGDISGEQVLYDTALTEGRRSTTVEGMLTPGAALQTLLTGSGLVARYTTDQSYTLVPAPVSSGSSPDLEKYAPFLGAAQGAILTAICANAETIPGAYDIKLRFGIDAAGAIIHLTLLASSGDPRRDTAILDDLSHTLVGQPPPGLAQPITMEIAPRSLAATGDCSTGR